MAEKTPPAIADLIPDPQNRRMHNARNLGMVTAALKEVGAARSIVIDEDDVILAGNGVTEAAKAAGITRLRVIDAEGDELIAVRRTGLTPDQKRALAIYDNRTAELAAWDYDQLSADRAAGLDLAPFWTEEEQAALWTAGYTPAGNPQNLTERFGVPPFSVLDARQGYWQERKRAWLSLGIESELGRGLENLNGARPETTSTIDFYIQKRALEAEAGHALTKDEAAAKMAEAGTLKDARAVNRARQRAGQLTFGPDAERARRKTRKANAVPGGSPLPGIRGPRKNYKPGEKAARGA